jgi:hypothetical protein
MVVTFIAKLQILTVAMIIRHPSGVLAVGFHYERKAFVIKAN